MASRISTLIALLLAAAGVHTSVQAQAHLHDRGVAAELAEQRKHEISDLSYRLHFSIPADRDATVTGRATIALRLTRRQELVLDFKAPAGSLHSVAVNGRTTACAWSDEHIIVPREATRRGANEVQIDFDAPDQSLNRNADYLYTLLVPDRARTLFPCFEQPSLKARFSLSLDIPSAWKALSNTPLVSQSEKDGRATLTFAETRPLSTYLFAFVVGRMEAQTSTEGGRALTAYYRETDTAKVAQLPEIFRQVEASLRWMEEYTGIAYPFAKYDFVILPGFQYGGMEHVGATLFNDTRMFLSPNATPDEQLARTQLIAHEVSHIWFGDLVTMDWFDDVWTKEVFANYFGLRISEPLFPDINHRLNWLMSYTAPALAEDRTPGTTPIRQRLDNLQDGGLIYGNIVYDKAPVMLAKLVELMGEAQFRDGLRDYLRTYAYKNATWDDLIAILDSHTPHDLRAFSRAWVYEKGMPTIRLRLDGRSLLATQSDPRGRRLSWPQSMDVALTDGLHTATVTLSLQGDSARVDLPFAPTRMIPNSDGRGYGLILPDTASTAWLLSHWQDIDDETARMATLVTLNEMYQAKHIATLAWASALTDGLAAETNALIATSSVNYLYAPLRELEGQGRDTIEARLLTLSRAHAMPSCRTQLLRLLIGEHRAPATTRQLYALWRDRGSALLSDDDYTTLAYELAVRLPDESSALLAQQRERIADPDRRRKFDFIARAAVADTASLDSLFRSLLLADNRRVEPWAASALAYLNHAARAPYAVKYIRPALEALQDVQLTGDIFFPRSWVGALLRHHRSAAAYREVSAFLAAHPDYPPMLRNKLLQAAYALYRANGDGQ